VVFHSKIKYIFQFFPLVCQGLLIIEASLWHSDTPHSVGLLWTSDRPDAETSTWRHTTITSERHPYLRLDSNTQSQRATANPRLRPRCHLNWLFSITLIFWTLTSELQVGDCVPWLLDEFLNVQKVVICLKLGVSRGFSASFRKLATPSNDRRRCCGVLMAEYCT
jgi:hypothetical protein